MNATSLPALRVLSLVWLSAATITFSQDARPRLPQVPVIQNRPALAPNMPQRSSAEPEKPLSTNYRLSFTGKAGEKALGELSALTCSPHVSVAGPLDASEIPTSFEVTGTIAEREGGLIYFDYQILFSVPVPQQTHSAKENGPVTTNYSYQRHSCTGSLLMKPGKAYDILKAGGATHSVTVTPDVEK